MHSLRTLQGFQLTDSLLQNLRLVVSLTQKPFQPVNMLRHATDNLICRLLQLIAETACSRFQHFRVILRPAQLMPGNQDNHRPGNNNKS